MFLMDMTFVDAFYLTVVSASTVGYGKITSLVSGVFLRYNRSIGCQEHRRVVRSLSCSHSISFQVTSSDDEVLTLLFDSRVELLVFGLYVFLWWPSGAKWQYRVHPEVKSLTLPVADLFQATSPQRQPQPSCSPFFISPCPRSFWLRSSRTTPRYLSKRSIDQMIHILPPFLFSQRSNDDTDTKLDTKLKLLYYCA